MTLASVTVERAAAAVAGGAGVGAGGLRADPVARCRRSAGSSRRRRPRCGCASSAPACARPATWVSKARSYSPSKCETSVEVPPMSKPITLAKPAVCAVRTMPTTPPAGPDRIESLPWNSRASVRPPFDCMNISRTSPRSLGDGVDVAAEDGRQVGVDDGGVAARDQLHQRAHRVADRDLREADGRARSRRCGARGR